MMLPGVLLAYRPFLDPWPSAFVPPWWLVMIVVVVLVSVAYKAVKLVELGVLWRQALMMSVQILAFMALAGLLIWVLTEVA